MLTRNDVDQITDQIVEAAEQVRHDDNAGLWERVRAILRTWTGT